MLKKIYKKKPLIELMIVHSMFQIRSIYTTYMNSIFKDYIKDNLFFNAQL